MYEYCRSGDCLQACFISPVGIAALEQDALKGFLILCMYLGRASSIVRL